MLINIMAAFGAGKSTLVEILSKDLEATKYLEDPYAIPILKDYYSGGKETRKKFGFPLQIAWLDERFGQLREAVVQNRAIMDSNLVADSIVYKVIHDRGETTDQEYYLYLKLLRHMLDSVSAEPKGHYPDLYVFLDISPENEVKNILERNREMETADPALIEYYHSINEGFKNWADSYSEAPIVRIDRNKFDFVNSIDDRIAVLNIIEEKLVELGYLTDSEFEEIKNTREKRGILE
ncbi:deoxyguanosine kinase [Lactobacillus phage ATCC 8014-B2]|uniref:Deoxyguanosine kinase n=1 Tax=Lactobacillus phage ATCC 8014-B2 TaxID=1225795 RepID=K4I4F1_9CAUD|nr:thymidylate kinase [Lactobacillus phage ATCC 8014-B2]AFU63150.1 deoxyguanosine kinase [Lactobacillus phage ATCC 8014-B2]